MPAQKLSHSSSLPPLAAAAGAGALATGGRVLAAGAAALALGAARLAWGLAGFALPILLAPLVAPALRWAVNAGAAMGARGAGAGALRMALASSLKTATALTSSPAWAFRALAAAAGGRWGGRCGRAALGVGVELEARPGVDQSARLGVQGAGGGRHFFHQR